MGNLISLLPRSLHVSECSVSIWFPTSTLRITLQVLREVCAQTREAVKRAVIQGFRKGFREEGAELTLSCGRVFIRPRKQRRAALRRRSANRGPELTPRTVLDD